MTKYLWSNYVRDRIQVFEKRITFRVDIHFMSKPEAKLLELYLMFLVSPLLFLLDIHIFLLLILLSMLAAFQI